MSNGEWLPFIDDYAHSFDGVEMVLVPAGCFNMGGDTNADSFGTGAGDDGGEQCFDTPFWMDRYEVTSRQFRQLNGHAARNSYFSGDNRPRENVTWFEARDFCTLRGARLPTEAEWEYVARGPDELIFPWGNEWVPENVVWDRSENDGTADVGSRPDGASWVGAYDMSGNVWEWVSTIFGLDDGDYNFRESGEYRFRYPYTRTDGRENDSDESLLIRVLRGGSWGSSDIRRYHGAYRSGYIPYSRVIYGGFRCARTYGS